MSLRLKLSVAVAVVVIGLGAIWIQRRDTGTPLTAEGLEVPFSDPSPTTALPATNPPMQGAQDERTALPAPSVTSLGEPPAPYSTHLIGTVVDERRDSLAGVRATLRIGERLAFAAGYEGPSREYELVTDSEGRLEFGDVPATGWHGLLLLVHESRGSLEVPTGAFEGGRVTDLGEIVLATGGSVRGRVVDERGLGLSAEVTWWSAGEGTGFGRGAEGTTTREDGSFLLGPL